MEKFRDDKEWYDCLTLPEAEALKAVSFLIDSDKFRTGFTLRFPRVEKFRDDKEWYDCLTLPEAEALKAVSVRRINKVCVL